MTDWLSNAVNAIGSETDIKEKQATATYMAMRKRQETEQAAQAAQVSNAMARISQGVPAETIDRNLPIFKDQQALARDMGVIRDAPGMHSWLANPRNAAAAQNDIPALGATSMFLGHPTNFPGTSEAVDPVRLREVAREAGAAPFLDLTKKHQPWELIRSLRNIKEVADATEAMHIAGDQAMRPAPTLGSLWHGVSTDVVQGWRQSYFGAAAFMSDMLGFDEITTKYTDKYAESERIATQNRPKITGWLGNGVYQGVNSFGQSIPVLASALLTGGGTALAGGSRAAIAATSAYYGAVFGGVQAGTQAYGKYRARGGTANEAALGATLEGGIEGATEYFPTKYLFGGLGKDGVGHFVVKYLGEEMLSEQIATFGQDAVDTAIANPTATWSQFWESRPAAARDTAIAVLTQSMITSGGAAGLHALVGTSKDIRAATEGIADTHFMDQLVTLAASSNLAKNDPEGFRDYVQQHVEGSRLENAFVPAETVRALFQDEGLDYHTDPYWGKYAAQIDDAAAKGGDVVIPLGDAAVGMAQPDSHWDKLRDDMRLSDGGVSFREAKAVAENYSELMAERGEKAGAADAASLAEHAPVTRVFDQVFSMARQSGFTINASRAYADIFAARYQTRAANIPGADAHSLFTGSIAGIHQAMPETLRPYKAADQTDVLIHAMRRGKEAKGGKGVSLLEFVAQHGGITDAGGDLASMGADKWHREQSFRRKLIREGAAGQGDMLGAQADNSHSIDRVMEAAIEAGYFPQYNEQRRADGSYADKPDTQVFRDAIARELHGEPLYATGERPLSETDARVKAAADDLRQFLDERGVDPDLASPDEIKAALNDPEADPAQRFFEQAFGNWNVAPAGMSPTLVLSHNGPPDLPRGRPMGMAANYFGTHAFADTHGSDFGPWRYTYWVPEAVAAKIIDLGDRTGSADQAGRELAAEIARRQWPDEPEYAQGLLDGDPEAWADFYETWADSGNLVPVLTERGLAGARFDQEHLLLPHAIASLVDRRNGPNDGTLTFYQTQPEHPVFYSALGRAVEGLKLAKAPAAQWMATLQNTSGVKAEELEWSGLPEWLAAQPGQVTRSDLQAFLGQGGVRVDEVVLGNFNDHAVAAMAAKLRDAAVAERAAEILQDDDSELSAGDGVETVEEVEDGFRFEGWTYDTEAEAEEARELAVEAAEAEEARRALYQATGRAEREFDPRHFIADAKAALGGETEFGDYVSTPEALPSYRELLITLPIGLGHNNPSQAPDTHWSQPGVVAHMRFQSKMDAAGNPVLFIEEVQSDWHQKGRDQGYAVPPSPEMVAAARDKREAAHNALEASQRAIIALGVQEDVVPHDEAPAPERGFLGYAFADTPLDEQASFARVGLARLMRGESSYSRDVGERPFDPALQGKVKEAIANLVRDNLMVTEATQAYANTLRGKAGIPEAPFKSSWPALVMKRAIRWAVDNGFHSVAWTTGEQQADRYNLAHQTGAIEVTLDRTPVGLSMPVPTYIVGFENDQAQRVFHGEVGGLLEQSGASYLTRAQVLEYFGDDLGQRMLDGADQSDHPFLVSGADVEVGGKGMKAFYDRNLINITNGLIKKYGARVSRQEVRDPTPQADEILRDAARTRAQAEAWEVQGNPRLAETLRSSATLAERTAKELQAAPGNAQWSFPITPELAAAASKGFALFQGGDTKARGRVDFASDGKALISLFAGRDMSTLLHEGFHVWGEELKADANRADAPQQIKDDWDAVRAWWKANGIKVSKSGEIPVEAHELWARAGERYLMEGKAPTTALARAFSSFRSWLIRIYQVVANLNAPITPEIRGVMDRLFAAQTEIDIKAQSTDVGLLTQEQLGMTDAEYASYVQAASNVRTEAFDAMLHVTMEKVRREKTKEYARQRQGVRREIEAEVDARPEFRALKLLRTKGEEGVRLDREAVVAEFGEDILPLLPRGVPPTVAEEGGVHPDILAQMSGFKTGREMIDMLVGVEARQREMRLSQDKRSVRQETIDIGTEKEMASRYGDPLNDGSIEEEALAGLHNDARANVLATQLRMIARRRAKENGQGETVPTPWTVARDYAEARVREGKVSEQATAGALARHQRNELKAGRAMQAALLKGDLDEAFLQAQSQMFNHALFRAAKTAKDQIDVIVRRLTKLAQSRGSKSMDPEYLDRIHQLLEAYDFRPRSAADRAERSSFVAWAKAKEEAGEEVTVPPRLRDAGKLNFKDATVEDLIALDDAVQSTAHLGRRKQTLMDGQKEAQFAEIVAEAVNRAGELPSRKFSNERNERPTLGKAARGLNAALVVPEFVMDYLDGNDPNGVFNRVLMRPATEAANLKEKLAHDVLQPIAKLFNDMPREMRNRIRRKVLVPELVTRDPDTGVEGPTAFEHSELISIALNTGNESNLEKMLRGESRIVSEGNAWTAGKVKAVLDRELVKEDWDFVEKVWRQIDTLWPAVVRAEKEISGVIPEKVVPRIVETPFGSINGGYYPVVYDPTRSAMAEANYEDDAVKLMGQMGRVISTPKGHTITRTAAAAPLLLSLEGVLLNHVNRVTTRIAYGRFVRDALKFLAHPKIKEIIDRKLGAQYRRGLKGWLQRQVNDASMNTAEMAQVDKILRHFRMSASMVGMGLRITTIVSQSAGIVNGIARVGPTWIARGAASVVAKATRGEMHDFVFSRSHEMEGRARTFDRDVRDFFQHASGQAGAVRKSLDTVRAASYWLIGQMQFYAADLPTWMGAYEKSLSSGMTDYEASAAADKEVRKSQSAGRAKDLSAIRDGNEWQKIATQFYSYWSVFYSTQWEIGQAARRGDWRRAGNTAFWVLMVAPILQAFITGDWPDDEKEESWFHWAMTHMFFGLWMGIPGVREVTAGVQQKLSGKQGYPAEPPLNRAFNALAGPITDAVKTAKGEPPSDRWVQNAITAPGYFLGLPTGQIGATAQYYYDVAEGNQHPEGVADVVRGTAKGPQKNQR